MKKNCLRNKKNRTSIDSRIPTVVTLHCFSCLTLNPIFVMALIVRKAKARLTFKEGKPEVHVMRRLIYPKVTGKQLIQYASNAAAIPPATTNSPLRQDPTGKNQPPSPARNVLIGYVELKVRKCFYRFAGFRKTRKNRKIQEKKHSTFSIFSYFSKAAEGVILTPNSCIINKFSSPSPHKKVEQKLHLFVFMTTSWDWRRLLVRRNLAFFVFRQPQ